MSKPIPDLQEKLLRLARRLPQASSLEHFIEIRRAAEAVRMQAKRDRLDLSVQIRAAEIKLRADRGAGRLLLKSSRLHVGRPPASSPARKAGVSRHMAAGEREANKKRYQPDTILKKLDLSNVESARLQKEARVPDRDYRQYLADCRDEQKVPSSQGLLRLAERLRVEGRLLKSPRARDGQKGRQPASEAVLSKVPKAQHDNDLRQSDDDAFRLAEMHRNIGEALSQLHDFFNDASISQLEHLRRRNVRRLLREVDTMITALRSDRQNGNPT